MKPKILIADDNQQKMDALCRETSKHPVELLTVDRTDAAVQLVQRHHDLYLAFMDYEISPHNGPAVIRHWRTLEQQENRKPAYICLQTSLLIPEIEEEARQAGANVSFDMTYSGPI